MTGDRLLSPEVVARRLGVAVHTLANWRASGKGPPFIKIERSIRYRESDVVGWLTRNRTDGRRLGEEHE